MNRVTVDMAALRHNIDQIGSWMEAHGASWTLVTKVLCGNLPILQALETLGVRSMGDSRLENLDALAQLRDRPESWYLRPPHVSALSHVVSMSDVSLNSEIAVVEALNIEAMRQGHHHRVVIMIELGDLREGLLPGSLVGAYRQLFQLSNIEVIGIGANLGCLAGTVPSPDQLTQLVLYRELLELKFERHLPLISAGSSAVLPLLHQGQVPRGVNHFRIGEAVFLGTDLVNGGTLDGLRNDGITLEAEVVEVKKKSLIPLGETTSMTPFEPIESGETPPGQRGYRALVNIGQLDTEVRGLVPIDEGYQIAGASSDIVVVNVGGEHPGVTVGDSIRFRPNYAALVRLMSGPYVEKSVLPAPRREQNLPLGDEPSHERADARQAGPSPRLLPRKGSVQRAREGRPGSG